MGNDKRRYPGLDTGANQWRACAKGSTFRTDSGRCTRRDSNPEGDSPEAPNLLRFPVSPRVQYGGGQGASLTPTDRPASVKASSRAGVTQLRRGYGSHLLRLGGRSRIGAFRCGVFYFRLGESVWEFVYTRIDWEGTP